MGSKREQKSTIGAEMLPRRPSREMKKRSWHQGCYKGRAEKEKKGGGQLAGKK